MYAIYGNIYHQYTPNVSIYTIHGSYGSCLGKLRLGPFKNPTRNHWFLVHMDLLRLWRRGPIGPAELYRKKDRRNVERWRLLTSFFRFFLSSFLVVLGLWEIEHLVKISV